MRKFELGALPADRGHPIVASSFRVERTRSRKLTPAAGTDAGKLFRTKKFFLDGFYHAIDFEGLRLGKKALRYMPEEIRGSILYYLKSKQLSLQSWEHDPYRFFA